MEDVAIWYSELISSMGERIPAELRETFRWLSESADPFQLESFEAQKDPAISFVSFLRLRKSRMISTGIEGHVRGTLPPVAGVSDDVRPFVFEEERTAMPDSPIENVSYAYQVTKIRNLVGIRASGLRADRGGARSGLSQNSSQREALLTRSKAHSQGKVTVGTGSRTIDNYRKKADAWRSDVASNLDILAEAKEGESRAYDAWQWLKKFPWLDDPRLDLFLTGNLYMLPLSVRKPLFKRLLAVNALNEAVILRIGGISAKKWETDPDDPQGYQTTEDLDSSRIEVLFGYTWIPIKGLNASEIQELLEEENRLLDELIQIPYPERAYDKPSQELKRDPDDQAHAYSEGEAGTIDYPRQGLPLAENREQWRRYLNQISVLPNTPGNYVAAQLIEQITRNPGQRNQILDRLRLGPGGVILGWLRGG